MLKTTPPHWWTAIETLTELRCGRIGAVDLLNLMRGRFEKLGPQLNAVIETQFELAEATSRAVDNGKIRGALSGLPMTIKDTFEVEGFGCRAGIPDLKDYRSARDADAVARLRAAGAVFWGKTNVPVAAADHQSYNPIFGVTNNPWDFGRSPGGSIRVPSHFCGTWGHKPSYGIVSQRGQVPPDPGVGRRETAVDRPSSACRLQHSRCRFHQ